MKEIAAAAEISEQQESVAKVTKRSLVEGTMEKRNNYDG